MPKKKFNLKRAVKMNPLARARKQGHVPPKTGEEAVERYTEKVKAFRSKGSPKKKKAIDDSLTDIFNRAGTFKKKKKKVRSFKPKKSVTGILEGQGY